MQIGRPANGPRVPTSAGNLAVIDNGVSTVNVIGFLCRECGYRWHAETPKFAGDILRGKA